MFGPFERAVAGRYLRARRGERFVSIIAIFSLVGIALGVATLIIVMAVMNGFQADLMGRILGLNGDLTIYGSGRTISAYETAAEKVRKVPGVVVVRRHTSPNFQDRQDPAACYAHRIAHAA